MDFLRAKLHDVKTVLEKGEIKESSKCWSEMLSETKAFMDFLLQSFRDISKDIYIYGILYSCLFYTTRHIKSTFIRIAAEAENQVFDMEQHEKKVAHKKSFTKVRNL